MGLSLSGIYQSSIMYLVSVGLLNGWALIIVGYRVEIAHKLIEDEFYDLEGYQDRTEFFAKAYAYSLYFNYKRKNRWKGHKAPVEILKETKSKIHTGVLNLPPILLDNYIDEVLNCGYHVPSSVTSTFILTSSGRKKD